MNRKQEDLSELPQWLEEFLRTGEFEEVELWSLIFVESGLKDADLRPLAGHLRNGFPLPPKFAGMIADAIENLETAPCRIYGKKKTGRPVGRARSRTNTHDVLTHTQKVDIGMASKRALCGVKRPNKQVVIGSLCKQFRVSETTLKNAQKYFEEWLIRMPKTIPTEIGT